MLIKFLKDDNAHNRITQRPLNYSNFSSSCVA